MSDRLNSRVEQLLDSSKVVLDQCALDNGALVAANSDLSLYPPTAENYRFSWARDAAYQLLAANALSPETARQRTLRYAQWLSQVQGFEETGLYLKRYGTNGSLDVRYGEHFQPDQAGALIVTLNTVIPESEPTIDAAIKKMADGLHGQWNGLTFSETQDLWENRHTVRGANEDFTYSLAAVQQGLAAASVRLSDITDTSHWDRSAFQLSHILASDTLPHYVREVHLEDPHATKPDNTLDASLNGLTYPFAASVPRAKAKETTNQIHKQLYVEGHGVYRYYGDTYDGIVREGSREAEAGSWPLLTFWHAMALHESGDTDTARQVYFDTIDRLDFEFRQGNLPNNIIPEQLYPDQERQGKGILPLAWSHAKFILATKALRITETEM